MTLKKFTLYTLTPRWITQQCFLFKCILLRKIAVLYGRIYYIGVYTSYECIIMLLAMMRYLYSRVGILYSHYILLLDLEDTHTLTFISAVYCFRRPWAM